MRRIAWLTYVGAMAFALLFVCWIYVYDLSAGEMGDQLKLRAYIENCITSCSYRSGVRYIVATSIDTEKERSKCRCWQD